MLYRTDIGGTRPLFQVDAPTFVTPVADARQESFERFAHIELGKLTMSEILSRLDDGTFMVKIANTAVRMNLPDGAKVGDSLPLTLISRDPRPTFLLGQQSGGAIATLSSAAKLIGNLLQAAQQEGAPASLVGKTALLPSPAGMQPAPLAGTLQDTLEHSGLFYESHVVQWAHGERSRAELIREPQARFERERSTPLKVADALSVSSARESVSAAPGSASPVTAPAESGHLQIDPLTGALVKVAPLTAQNTERQPQLELTGEAAHLVSLQLETLESNRIVWRGDLWPGQPMEWEVSEDTHKGGTEEAEKIWRSVLRLDLPTLGSIHATIQLAGNDVHLQVRTDSAHAVAALRAHGGELAAALQAAGTHLDFVGFSVDGAV